MLMVGRRRGREAEGGFAIVIALLITAIAFLILTAVLAQAIHNVVLAGHGRRRLAAVNAAEGGLNWYSNLLSTSPVPVAMNAGLGWTLTGGASCWNAGTAIPNTCWYVLGPTTPTATAQVTVATKPELATFELRVLLLSQNPCKTASGAQAQCGLNNVTVRPTVWSSGQVVTPGILKAEDTTAAPWPDTAYMVVRSTGIVGTVKRTLESYVRLRAVRTQLPGGFVSDAVCFGNATKLIVNGDFSIANQAAGATASGFDGECKSGNLRVDSGESLDIRAYGTAGGTLQIRGGGLDADLNSTLAIQANVRAENEVKLGSGTASPYCPTGNSQCVQGSASGSTVTVGSNAYVAGVALNCVPLCPPTVTFPTMTWDQQQWINQGFSIVNVASTSGLLDAMEAVTAPTVYHITGGAPGCDLSFTSSDATNADVLLKTQVAVVSQCQFRFNASTAAIKPATGSESTAALLLVSAAPAVGTASCGSPTRTSIGPQDIEINQNPTIKTGFFVYTPCYLWLGNNQNPLSGGDFIQGQFAGRFLMVDQAVTLTQVNIGNFVSTLPGQLTGFKQDVRFVREILWTIAAANAAL